MTHAQVAFRARVSGSTIVRLLTAAGLACAAAACGGRTRCALPRGAHGPGAMRGAGPGTRPALTVTAATTRVTTTATTTFRDGPCTAVVTGAQIEVKGTRNADGSLTATSVETNGDEGEPSDDDGA